ncbi:hypothetical protein CsSME_00046320 [Camellia sinensis var. sinensis]
MQSVEVKRMRESGQEEEEKNNNVGVGIVNPKVSSVHISKVDEYQTLADLTNFPNLSSTLAFKATRRKNRKKKKNKNRKIEIGVQNDTVCCTTILLCCANTIFCAGSYFCTLFQLGKILFGNIIRFTFLSDVYFNEKLNFNDTVILKICWNSHFLQQMNANKIKENNFYFDFYFFFLVN